MKRFLLLAFVCCTMVANSFSQSVYTIADDVRTNNYFSSVYFDNDLHLTFHDAYRAGSLLDRKYRILVYERTSDSHIYQEQRYSSTSYTYGYINATTNELVSNLVKDTTVYVSDTYGRQYISFYKVLRQFYNSGVSSVMIFVIGAINDGNSFSGTLYHPSTDNTYRDYYKEGFQVNVPYAVSNVHMTEYISDISSHIPTAANFSNYNQKLYYGDTITLTTTALSNFNTLVQLKATLKGAGQDTLSYDSTLTEINVNRTKMRQGFTRTIKITCSNFLGASNVYLSTLATPQDESPLRGKGLALGLYYPLDLKGIMQYRTPSDSEFEYMISQSAEKSFWKQPGDTVLLTSCGGDWALPSFSTPVVSGQLSGDTVFFVMPSAPLTVQSNATQAGCIVPCGDNATYMYDPETRHLTICGSGVLRNSGWTGGCNQAETIDIPEGITEISNMCFYRFHQLREVVLPSTVTKIGEYAFHECDSLQHVVLPENLLTIGQRAFWVSKIREIVVPDKVVNLPLGVFGATAIEHITLGKSVQTIGASAFYNRETNVQTIICRSMMPPSIQADAFRSTQTMDMEIYVPCEGESYYTSSAWNDFGTLHADQVFFEVTVAASEGGEVVFDQQPTCDDHTAIIRAIPADGYRFLRWNDGQTDNPRTIPGAFYDQHFVAIFEHIDSAIETIPVATDVKKVMIDGHLYIIKDGARYNLQGMKL